VLELFTSSPDYPREHRFAYTPVVGTKNVDGSVSYFSTMKGLFDANCPNRVSSPSDYRYSEELRLALRHAIAQGRAGAQDAYNWLYPISTQWLSGRGAGFAIKLL
jgi:hypothetical protein